jgi:hypothetical protein
MKDDDSSRDEDRHVDPVNARRPAIGRRAFVTRAGALAAIAGTAIVADAASGPAAEAAAGDNLILGQLNNSGAQFTTLSSTSTTGPTLMVQNTSVASTTTHGPLLIDKSSDNIFASTVLEPGEMFAGAADTDLFYVNNATAPSAAMVFTEATANQVVGIQPVRMLDSRTAGGRSRVLNPQVFAASGQLRALQWLQLDLTSLADFFESAFVNVTAVAPTAAGYMAIVPEPPAGNGAPGTSSLNYVKGVTTANAAVVPTVDGTVWIYSRATTHVLVDVTALNLPSTEFLIVSPAVAAPSKAELRSRFAGRRDRTASSS